MVQRKAGQILLVLLCGAVMTACTRTLPSRLSRDDFQLYSAWLLSYGDSRNPPHRELFVYDLTFPVSSLFSDGVPDKCRAASRDLLNPLLALGEAQYPIYNNAAHSLVVPFSYRLVDGPLVDHGVLEIAGGYDTVRFSRAAFNHSRSEAIFAVGTGHCYPSGVADGRLECGGGTQYFVRGKKASATTWQFERIKDCPFWFD